MKIRNIASEMMVIYNALDITILICFVFSGINT